MSTHIANYYEKFKRGQTQEQREHATVDRVREELRPAYEHAKIALAEFGKKAPPYAAFAASIEPAPTPQVSAWVENMKRLLSSMPRQLGEAIDGYDRLTFPMIADDHSKAIFVNTTRALLNSHDGALASLEFTRKQIERWFHEWSERFGGAHPSTVGVVQGGFDVGAYIAEQEERHG